MSDINWEQFNQQQLRRRLNKNLTDMTVEQLWFYLFGDMTIYNKWRNDEEQNR